MKSDSRVLRVWQFVTIMLVVVNVSALAAHVMELAPKMGFEADLYVRLHRTLYPYFGAVAGTAEGLALLSVIGLAWGLRPERAAFGLTVATALLLVLSHIVFWVFVYPANTTMASWSLEEIPSEWTSWRDRWEYGHAARAGLTFIALGLLVASAMRRAAGVASHAMGFKQQAQS